MQKVIEILSYWPIGDFYHWGLILVNLISLTLVIIFTIVLTRDQFKEKYYEKEISNAGWIFLSIFLVPLAIFITYGLSIVGIVVYPCCILYGIIYYLCNIRKSNKEISKFFRYKHKSKKQKKIKQLTKVEQYKQNLLCH
jgi:hypothetical protein